MGKIKKDAYSVSLHYKPEELIEQMVSFGSATKLGEVISIAAKKRLELSQIDFTHFKYITTKYVDGEFVVQFSSNMESAACL